MIGKNEKLEIKKFVVGPLCTNCYLVWEKLSRKGMLVDPGSYDREVAEYMQDNEIDVECILNTHGHADHIGGNVAFGFPVLIHELDESYLRDSTKNLSFVTGEDVAKMCVKRLLIDGDIISLGELEFLVIHTPGHTPGSISLKYRDILFSGDALFFEGIGRTDVPGGDYEVLAHSIRERLFTLPDSVKVFPGHGPETTIGHEKKNNPFF